MSRFTTIGVCVALAVVGAGSIDGARALECCRVMCDSLPFSGCTTVEDFACDNFCDAACEFIGGCSDFRASTCSPDLAVVDCDNNCGAVCATFTATATATATQTATGTATATSRNTPVPQGGACITPAQCTTDFCVDGVCCNTACNGPMEQCNLPGEAGTCVHTAAGAPTLTPWGLIAVAIGLAGVGALTLRRRLGRE